MDLNPRTILLPIDMQRAFDDAPWPRRWNRDLDRNGQALLAAWRRIGWPLIHVRHDSVETGSSLGVGLPGHAYRPGFEPRPGEPVVAKSVNAAFIGTDLDLQLRRLGVEAIVAFGISTDMCVSTSVRVGANLGYRMLVVSDACDCFDLTAPDGRTIPAEEIHAAHLATLAYDFATPCTTAEVLAALSDAAVRNGRDGM